MEVNGQGGGRAGGTGLEEEEGKQEVRVRGAAGGAASCIMSA